MPNESNKKKNKQNQNYVDKLLAIPGVSEAIKMVRRYALKGAREYVWVSRFLQRLLRENAEKFVLDDSNLDYELSDELLESLALEAGPKIAELWNLSERAGDRLAEIIYWGENAFPRVETPLGRNTYLLPFVLVVNTKEPKTLHALNYKGATLIPHKEMSPNHIYLDVTSLPYDAFHLAYRSIVSCRHSLGLQKNDLREGAPETFDTAKAIKCAELADMGNPSKEIARKFKFTVYDEDNPSGTYPLFRKYLKKGREIREKLSALEKFLGDEISFLLEQL